MPSTKEPRKFNQYSDNRETYEQRFLEGFREFGIANFPPYKTAEDFARQFRRCSILTTEKIIFSSSSGSSTHFPSKK